MPRDSRNGAVVAFRMHERLVHDTLSLQPSAVRAAAMSRGRIECASERMWTPPRPKLGRESPFANRTLARHAGTASSRRHLADQPLMHPECANPGAWTGPLYPGGTDPARE